MREKEIRIMRIVPGLLESENKTIFIYQKKLELQMITSIFIHSKHRINYPRRVQLALNSKED